MAKRYKDWCHNGKILFVQLFCKSIHVRDIICLLSFWLNSIWTLSDRNRGVAPRVDGWSGYKFRRRSRNFDAPFLRKQRLRDELTSQNILSVCMHPFRKWRDKTGCTLSTCYPTKGLARACLLPISPCAPRLASIPLSSRSFNLSSMMEESLSSPASPYTPSVISTSSSPTTTTIPFPPSPTLEQKNSFLFY